MAPRKMNVEDYREEMLANSRRTLTIFSGDPNVTDKNDPDHYVKSVMGRLDAVEEGQDDLRNTTGQAVALLKEAIEDLRIEVRTNVFGWPTVNAWVRKHWVKILIVFVLLALERDRAIALVNGLLKS